MEGFMFGNPAEEVENEDEPFLYPEERPGQVYYVTPENVDLVATRIAREAIMAPHRVNYPLMLLIRVKDMIHRTAEYFAARFSPNNLDFLLMTVREPWFAWEYYQNTAAEIDSRIASLLQSGDEEEADPHVGVYQVSHLAVYNEDIPIRDQHGLHALWQSMPRISNVGDLRRHGSRRQRRVGRFMSYSLDFGKLTASNSPYAKWLKNEANQRNLAEWFQIPWFENSERLSEDGGFIEDEIFAIPCFLYAIKRQLADEELYKKIKNSGLIHGYGVKTSVFKKMYDEFHLAFQIQRIYYYNENQFKVQTDHLPKLKKGQKYDLGTHYIHIMHWEDHYMEQRSVYIDVEGPFPQENVVSFLRVLECLKQEGILKRINAYEYTRMYENYAFDEMIHFDDKAFIRNTPNSNFEEDNWNKLEYVEKKGVKDVWFADFEASTNEQYHRPYLIVAKGYEITEKNNEMSYKIKEIDGKDNIYFWGEDCGFKFLTKLAILYGVDYSAKIMRTKCRVYFHNLHYDFTFLLKYLVDVKEVRKGNTIYSVKGTFKYGPLRKKVRIDFWDSLPIFQCSLKKATELYLTPEQKKTVRKEVFPYNFYTYDMFNLYETGLCPISCFESNFNEEQKKDFHEVIDNHAYLCVDDQIDYIQYAIFYCLQDVNCLSLIMLNFANLLYGKSLEGINGVPPFCLSLWKYRTASSIGYEYFQRTVMFKEQDDTFVPRYDWYVPKCELRALIQKSIKGGRVMVRDNLKQHVFYGHRTDLFIQDYDFVSLYPTAMSRLWITDGKPTFLKGLFTTEYLIRNVVRPEYDEKNYLEYQKPFRDAIFHVNHIVCNKKLHFPLYCKKDPKTRINNYINFNCDDMEEWINAIDLYNLVDFQNATFVADAAIVWTGERRTEVRESIKNLFDFRKDNKKHPIQQVTKLMLNSIFGKSILKPIDKEKKIIDKYRYRKNKTTGQYEQVDNWLEFFSANAYRINRFSILPFDKFEVELLKRDVSSSFNIFGSNVLAMARRIIGRVMALAEDLEEQLEVPGPALFYTDTDSMHIRSDLLKLLKIKYKEKYGEELNGVEMGQCHEDFDVPSNFKEGEKVLGANESFFIMKKVYADQLIGDKGSVGYHIRMKGIPTDLVHFDDYRKIFNNEAVEFDLLNGHCSFFYKDGHVGTREVFKRKVMTKEAREESKKSKNLLKK